MLWLTYLKKIGILILVSIFLFQLIQTLIVTYRAGQNLEVLKENVYTLDTERTNLENELEYRQSNEFVEQEARDRLNLLYPGEVLVVFNNLERVLGVRDQQMVSGSERQSIPYQWWQLFFMHI